MRVLSRVLAPLFALALAALGVLAIVEVAAAWIAPVQDDGLAVPWVTWRAALERTAWQDSPVALVGIGVGVVGLALVLVAVLGRRHDVPMRPPEPGITVTITPTALARMVGQRVRGAGEVSSAAVTASRRSINVRAEGWSGARGGLPDVVRAEVAALLDELPLASRPRVSVAARDLDRQR